MTADTYVREISQSDLDYLTELGAASAWSLTADVASMQSAVTLPPLGMDEEALTKWKAEQEEQLRKFEAEQAKQRKEEEKRRKKAESAFKAALDERLTTAFKEGAADAVSREVHTATRVRSYVLLGVVAAVVSMPLIGMLLHLDPQAFGAFIAPVTGIAGTIVGYWFGTVGQDPLNPRVRSHRGPQ